MEKIKVGVIGHTGRLGKPLVKILKKHPAVDIVYTESRGKGCRGKLSQAEIVFLALPYGESKKYIPKLKGKRIIDLSIDHRNKTGCVYGLPEVFKNEIMKARIVANPGCYATSILLALYPIKDYIRSIEITSVSGRSGAGIGLKKENNILIYKEGNKHPQIKEISRVLGVKDVLFTPIRIDSMEKGIVSSIFVETKKKVPNIQKIYRDAYQDCQFVRICGNIETKNVLGTNFCDLKIAEFSNKLLIISALDNTAKGGAKQAVQNFNLMYGLEEELSLNEDS